uniref:Uncharacterized protein n=1 Tax=Eutreptiella gymnastica TaxID=73025 RepID=A0A7S1JB44_9EUGL|mmetsp:Transcript_81066/g.142922  ORF Transcript_81066/g.142922 Transcript_81066/m.142922 type:complete len:222 (+) Transcript_81066:68-733(+)
MFRSLVRPIARQSVRTFFNDGYRDNASLELVYRAVIRSPAVTNKLTDFYAANCDELSVESMASLQAAGSTVGIPLQPYLGDPHRVLLAYSLLPNTVETEADGNPVIETVIGDEKQRIKIVDPDLISFLAKELLAKLGLDTSSESAKNYLDSMVDGAEALYAKIPKIAPSPLEAAMAAIDAETCPADTLRNMATTEEMNKVKFANMPHPISKKVEGKFKYFL